MVGTTENATARDIDLGSAFRASSASSEPGTYSPQYMSPRQIPKEPPGCRKFHSNRLKSICTVYSRGRPIISAICDGKGSCGPVAIWSTNVGCYPKPVSCKPRISQASRSTIACASMTRIFRIQSNLNVEPRLLSRLAGLFKKDLEV